MNIRERLYALPNPSRRKCTLFACVCAREIWHLLDDDSKKAIVAAEGYVEGLVNQAEMKKVDVAAAVDACAVAYYAATTAAYGVDAYAAAYYAATTAAYGVDAYASANKKQALAKQHQLFDDIFNEHS